MRWVTAGLVVLSVALAGLSYYGWQAIQQLEGEIEALGETQEAGKTLSETLSETISEAIVEPRLATMESRLATMGSEVDDLADEIGTDTTYRTQSVWDTVNELWAIIPGLVSTPVPTKTVQPIAPLAPEGPSVQWCAQFQLALEVAADESARAQGRTGANWGEWQDNVLEPLLAAGCPNPND